MAGSPTALRALRGDARVGVAVLVCVSLAAGVAWFRAGIAPALGPGRRSGADRTAADRRRRHDRRRAVTTTTTAHDRRRRGRRGSRPRSRQPAGHRAGARRDPGRGRCRAGAADLDRLNLAAKLADGARVAVPAVGQPPPAVDPTAVSGSHRPGRWRTGRPASGADPSAPVERQHRDRRRSSKRCPGSARRWRRRSWPNASATGRSASVDDLTRGARHRRRAASRSCATSSRSEPEPPDE